MATPRLDLSYAQNLEDHHLWLAFGGRRDGFYIDVGGGHPVADNVSCWFYLQGWRGLVVEPQDDLAALYAHIRPRDLVWCGIAGRTEGMVDFHRAERLHGFSTIDPEAAAQAGKHGAVFRTVPAPMRTLTGLCDAHAIAEIDFLKIDVEGAEAEVLAGLDLSRLRPKVLCIEAVAPGTMAPNWSGWEPMLLAANYELVLFEGLNRFYVARENVEILARFPRAKADWLVAPHLGHTNRAPWRDDHPDHDFARHLVGSFLAMLPVIDRTLLMEMVTRTETQAALDAPASAEAKARVIGLLFPDPERHAHASADLIALQAPSLRGFYEQVIDSDAFRVMTGRLAMSFDGGQILDD
jgi:FkbM family methyltransferase